MSTSINEEQPFNSTGSNNSSANLPSMSKDKYMTTYENFLQWKKCCGPGVECILLDKTTDIQTTPRIVFVKNRNESLDKKKGMRQTKRFKIGIRGKLELETVKVPVVKKRGEDDRKGWKPQRNAAVTKKTYLLKNSHFDTNTQRWFKFCSDGDCPLWALAALHALGSLPAPLFRTLLQHVLEEQPDDGIMEILKETSLSSREEGARAAAVIRWVMTQTMRCACSSTQLTRDLLVLGVPRAHAAAFAEAANSAKENHLAHVQSNGFMVNKLTDANISCGPEGTVDSYKLTLFTENSFIGEQKRNELLIDKSLADTLLADLKKIYQKMEELENKDII